MSDDADAMPSVIIYELVVVIPITTLTTILIHPICLKNL